MRKQPDRVFDELLINRIKAGDRKAMNLFIKRWNKRLQQRILYLVQDVDATQDITQEAWTGILRNIDRLKNTSVYVSWMMTIASRKSYDWIRSKKRKAIDRSDLSPDELPNNQSETDDAETDTMKKLKQCIRTLSEDHRVILTLYYLDHLSILDISKQLKLPKGTVKSRLFYSRELLKKRIKKEIHHET